jgi:hypothetical protein
MCMYVHVVMSLCVCVCVLAYLSIHLKVLMMCVGDPVLLQQAGPSAEGLECG